MANNKRILFLCPYPHGEAPSQRFRFEQYFKYLKQDDYVYHQKSFLDQKTWSVLYKKGYFLSKFLGVILGFIRRMVVLFTLRKYDYVFVHREATPIGFPFVEWSIAKLWKKKLIYDFDDAIWLTNTSSTNAIVRSFKNHRKVKYICKWSYKVSCGNNFLREYAKKYNDQVIVLPTTLPLVDIENNTKKHKASEKMVIGWVGTHSTLKYLQILVPVLKNLEESFNFIFRVISNKCPDLAIKSLEFVKWSRESEIQDILGLDIGVMPLPNTDWEKGKCSFKALQYMSYGVCPVVSPVGMNNEVIQPATNGYLCENEEQWKNILSQLLIDNHLRQLIGNKGKETILRNFTDEAKKGVFLSLFE